ncbi:MAG: Hsp20/alpha crystallin family protein [Gammaproteobacteria bacterium]|nr:Hsp20/alpha crystallin family protein [Gammaproteobacteria bacterium]
MKTQLKTKHMEEENVVPFRTASMLDEMERMFENFMPHSWLRPFRQEHAWMGEAAPYMDVIDRDDYILVRAALPGVNKNDLEVSTTTHSVTIRGSTKSEKKEEKGEYYRHEISLGDYLRTVTLPASVDESKVKAVFRDGMLELTLPKLESAKRHTIEIEED